VRFEPYGVGKREAERGQANETVRRQLPEHEAERGQADEAMPQAVGLTAMMWHTLFHGSSRTKLACAQV
jgi:hypothetical protein